MTSTILTIITKIEPDNLKPLEAIFNEIESDLDNNSYIPFAKLSLLHFASFVIIDDKGFDSYLVFENNFDGLFEPYLDELLQYAGTGLHQIYNYCPDYPDGPYEPSKLASYLHSHAVRPNAFHIGNVGRKAKQIKQEKQLREGIQGFLDDYMRTGKSEHDPSSLYRSIGQFVQNDSSLNWASEAIGPNQTLAERIMPWANIVIAGIFLFLLLPILIPLAAVWIIVLRRKEKRDSESSKADPRHIRELARREDRIVQNHLAHITTVKPGWFRRTTLRLVLWAANLLARTSNKGKLSGIPSIHFAHWSLIDKGRRLLFLSNFDGSWGSYLDDFIDKASFGLTGIWSNTEGFPATRFLVLDGAKNEAEFKAFGRDNQVLTRVWYSAYSDLTVQNIDRDSLIRRDIFKPLDDKAVKTYLQLF